MRQHVLGPYPIDPNLIAQGIPPDDRVDFNERIYAPVEGTPLPPGAVPAGTPPDAVPPGAPPPGPLPGPAPACRRRLRRRLRRATRSTGCRYRAAPPAASCRPATVRSPLRQVRSAATVLAARRSRSRTTTRETGEYMTPDGQLQQLTNLAAGGAPKSWKDLLPI